MRKLGWYILLFLLLPQLVNAQGNTDRIQSISNQLESLEQKGINLSQPITISLNGSIQELVTFLGESTGINLSIDSRIKNNVSTSFTEAPVKDILIYLCDVHQLDIRFSGSIIQLINYDPPLQITPVKDIEIEFDQDQKLLTLNLTGDTLSKVAKKISELTGLNIAVSPNIQNNIIRGFINKADIATSLQQIAIGNGLELEEEENFFLLKSNVVQNPGAQQNKQQTTEFSNQNLSVRKNGSDRITVKALNVPIIDVIRQSAIKLNANYYLLPDSDTGKGNAGANQRNSRSGGNSNQAGNNQVSIQIQNATFSEVLEQVCQNSEYTFTLENGIYVIGKRTAEGLRETKVIQLQYRSAQGVLEFIPNEMIAGVDIDTLLELNSLILSGSQKNIVEIDTFIKAIDQVIPVVMIELIIVDVQNSKLSEFGVEAGVVPGGRDAGGQITSESGYDFTFSPGAINRVLDLLSGRNIINLGQVTDNFYLTLKAVEEQGFIDIKSTPKLSTLNSHDAVLSIGEKRYYLEQQVNFPGSDRPIPVQSNRFQEVEANLDILITPIVSGDDQVTLDIYFEQSEFVGAPVLNQPPPQVSRRFESMIRVKNGEMVVLGGLERDLKSNTRRGVPWLSRIPLIGWMFGKKKKNKSKNKLMVFVKPTIID